MRDALEKAFLTTSLLALSLVGADVFATFMFLLREILNSPYSPRRWSIEKIPLPRRVRASAAKKSVMSISKPPAYFFFTLLIENHVVDSIHNAERTATIGVSSPRISAIPPKNSTNPPNGTIAGGIPTLFIQAPPCFLWVAVSFGYP